MQEQTSRGINHLAIVLAVAVVALGANGAASARGKFEAPYSTPPSITLVNVTKIYVSSQDQFLWRRLGDANGKPLYTYDSDSVGGKPTCTGECAKEFTPFAAERGARAAGDWSLVSAGKGIRQWAYQGKPLYRYTGTDPSGIAFAGDTASAVAEDPAWYDPASKLYSPKTGWRRAAYTPEKSLKAPPELALQALGIANGFGLVDRASGMTIYALSAKRDVSADWVPVPAPALGVPVGDFTVAKLPDGERQWLYKGQKLYTYKGDYVPGDVTGIFLEKDVSPALVYRNFMPDSVVINRVVGRGPLMMTKDGLSVYTEARYNLQYGGRETRTGYTIPYHEAKAVGTQGCVDDCTQNWKPLLAPDNAQSSGFWEVMSRPDGSKQWAYKGSALYTYADDSKPGDIRGNNRHVIVYGDPEGKVSLALTVGDRRGGGASYQAGSGFYWHLASLVY